MTSQILKYVDSLKTEIQISCEQNIIFSPNKKLHSLHFKTYNVGKNVV